MAESTTTTEGSEKSETALREEALVTFWKEKDIFGKSLRKESPKGEFVFFDGPPFATGLPHYGSLLSSVIKDVIPRFKTMQGYHVPRRWGWDCHGLPIENLIEKRLGLKTKKDIETIGVERFNEEARASVLEYVHDWKEYVDRIGRFVDFDHSYKTMDNSYIESVWWGLKQLNDRGRLYEGKKVLMYCPHCETPLAKAEIAQDNSYQDITEEAVTVKFKLKNPELLDLSGDVFLLAWTTTPWTLPGNVALAVGADIEYAVVKKEGSTYILAEELLSTNGFETADSTVRGSALQGLSYEPLYSIPGVAQSGAKAHYVSVADFVTVGEGTGIVHTAVMYGEDDYLLGQSLHLPMIQLLNPNATYNDEAPEFVRGVYIKKAEAQIKEDLTARGLLFARAPHTHSYPHCYRCGTPLIYNALSSWFIDIQSVKPRLLELNEEVTWVPDHLKHGRFKYILEGAPDWNISRNRYWASPLPIWKNPTTGTVVVIGSVEELRARAKKTGNRYFIMRHGEADSNVQNILSTKVDNPHHLTEAGKAQVTASAEALKEEHIDLIITSPFVRTRETSEIVRATIGLSPESVIVEERLREVNAGIFEGKSLDEYRAFGSFLERMTKVPEGGESLEEVGARAVSVLFDLEEKYHGKNILVVSHGSPLLFLDGYSRFLDPESIAATRDTFHEMSPGSYTEIPFFAYPHRANYIPDLHRPYIDRVELVDDDGTPLTRISEVVDCWLESGSMPFASEHYPFENEEKFEKHFPGDFIAEYIAQTRTWFYYMHVMATELWSKRAFKSVVSTGTVLASDGSKMSKSKGNYTDPKANFDRYGADAIRAYLMGSVVMQAEDLRFQDADIREVHNRMIGILWNVFKFFEQQKSTGPLPTDQSPHVLDRWILSRLGATGQEVTHALTLYTTTPAVRALRLFIDDLSTWYLRRSRDRFKSDDESDRGYATQTMTVVLNELSRYMAPFMPFLAESIYQGTSPRFESVHLESWPETRLASQDELILMAIVRDVVSKALEARASSGIKIRQPLPLLTIQSEHLISRDEYLALIREEVNVKDIRIDPNQAVPVLLDTTLTPELLEEGALRDFLRTLQQTRKDLGMRPEDTAKLLVASDERGLAFIARYVDTIKTTAGISDINSVPLEGEDIPEITLLDCTVRFALLP